MHPLGSMTVALAVAGLLLASGCGDSEEDEARTAVTEYVEALRAGDPAAVCERLTPDELADLAAASSCTEVFSGAFSLLDENGVEVPEFEISEITVDGDAGEVTLASEGVEQSVPLEKVEGEWKLAGATTIDQFHPDEPLATPPAESN